jgi:hypothetical protein
MKREYNSPEVEIEKFLLSANSMITTSEKGIEDGGDTEEVVDF